jgi:hypothetical protein
MSPIYLTCRYRTDPGRPFSTSRSHRGRPPPSCWGSCVRREIPLFLGDVGVQVVPQEISAIHPAVSIEHSEVGWLLPVGPHVLGLGEIEDDGHSVLIVLPHWSLVGGGGVGPDGAVPVLAVLGWLEVGDGDEYFGECGVLVLGGTNAASLYVEGLGLDEDLLPDDLVDLFGWRFGLGARLVLVTVLDGRGLRQLQPLVRVVELPLFPLSRLTAVEVGGAFLLRVLGGGGLGDFDLGGWVWLERHACAHGGEDGGNFGGVLGRLGSEVFGLRLF